MYNKASRVMNKENQDLRNKIESNKNFLNMVIHDLKHPVEAINIKLKHFIEQLDSNIYTHKILCSVGRMLKSTKELKKI